MKRTYYNNTSFLDILFNFLLATVILLVIAVSFIITEQNKADIKVNAEFVITLEWDHDQDNDIDVWIEDPDGSLLWYRDQKVGVMHGDRDDKGWSDDIYINGEIIKINQEIITFRGIIEGEWIINIHFYRIGIRPRDKEGSTIKISLIKLNPKATIIFKKEYRMETYWEQITVARFHMTSAGTILELTDGPFKDLIEDRANPSTATTEPTLPGGGRGR